MIDVNTARICAQVAIDAPYLMEHEAMTACKSYLALTDPTPLTVEGVVEAGGVRESSCSHHIRFPFGLVVAANPDGDWYWRVERDEWHSSLLPERVVPRTVGELAMLLAMMEGR